MYLLDQPDLRDLVRSLSETHLVVGPVRKGKDYAFSLVKEAADIDLSYQTTILPPKKVFHKPLEVLFSFQDGVITHGDVGRAQVLFGVHPCDLHAITILDTIFRRDFPDPYFIERKESTVIVALNCATVGEDCFCLSMGTGPWVKDPCDLLLTPVGDTYLLETMSPKGAEILSSQRLEPVSRDILRDKSKVVEEARRHFRKRVDTNGLRAIMEDNFRHPLWDELMKDCMGCGSCTMVCPTCFCYNVVDRLDLSLTSGRREREWDSCMLLEYSEAALGANFRKDRDARIKQRMYHKLVYYEPQFGTLGCVGCGRCISTCLKKIDITEVVARLRGV